MEIRYSNHLKTRLVLRNLAYDLPEQIFKMAEEQYVDEESKHNIAVKKVNIYGKERDVMVAYTHETNVVKLLTIHPLKNGQKENRIKSGRWRKLQ